MLQREASTRPQTAARVTRSSKAGRGPSFWLAAVLWVVSVTATIWLSLSDPPVLGLLAFTTVGALVGWLRPLNPVGWLLLVDGLIWIAGGAAAGYVSTSASAPLAEIVAAVFDHAGWIAALGLIPLALLIFPTGRPMSGGWVIVAWLLVGGGVVLALANLVTPGPLPSYPTIRNPMGMESLRHISPVVATIAQLIFLLGGGGAVLAVLVRFRRASGVERQQLKWLAFAASLLAVGVVTGNVMTALDLPGAWVLYVVPSWAVPIAVAIALLRYRLWDLDLVVEQAATFALLALGITVIYVAMIAGLGALIGGTGDVWLAVLSTAIAAVLFQPARHAAEASVRHVVFPLRSEPVAAPITIRTLGSFRVDRAGRPVPASAWQSRKARQLLKMLIARRGRPVHREQLIDALWPDETVGNLPNRLAAAASTVRGVLDPDKAYPSDYFLRGDADTLQLDLEHVAVDVEAFLATAASTLRDRDGGAELDDADASYIGDFLEEDAYEDWSQPLREEARAMHLAVLRARADVERQHGVDAAVAAQLRLLEIDPWDEAAHLAIVTALEDAGRHGEARRARDRYAARMQEIGITPETP